MSDNESTTESNEEQLFENLITSSSDENESDDDEIMASVAGTIENMFSELIASNVTIKNMDKIAQSFKELLQMIEILVISKAGVDNTFEKISDLFSDLKDQITPFTTEYRRKKELKKNPFYVEPEAISFGSVTKVVRRKHRQCIITKPLILYKVPVRKTIEALFKNEQFKIEFSKSQLHVCQPGIYKNVCCGRVYENTPLRNKNIIKIQLYNDAVNVGDALKQNANQYKIGAFYFRILNLPAELQTLQKNIHLCGLYNENDLKQTPNGLNTVLKYIVDMFVELEELGLAVEIVENVVQELEPAVCSTAADNLAIHQIFGNQTKLLKIEFY